jgi:hypothetical protein
MMAGSLQGSSGRPPTLPHSTSHSLTKLIARHACDSLSPWSIKGGRTPLPQGTGTEDGTQTRHNTTRDRLRHALALQFPTTSSATTPGTWKPRFLSRLACSSPTTGTPGAEQYSALSTPLLDVRPPPAETRINSVFYCLASTIEG